MAAYAYSVKPRRGEAGKPRARALGNECKQGKALKGRSRCMLELVYNDVSVSPGLYLYPFQGFGFGVCSHRED